MTFQSRRLKTVADLLVSNVDKKANDGERPVRLCNYVDVYYHDRITTDLDLMLATATDDEIDKFTLRPGDVVITKDSETAEDIGVPARVCTSGLVCGYHLAIVRSKHAVIHGGYLFWLMASDFVRSQLTVVATGVTRFGLRYESIGGIRVPLPSIQVQTAIANHLDAETARIDALIEKRRRMVKLLEERIDSMIRQHIAESPLAGPGGSRKAVPIKRALTKMRRSAAGRDGDMVTAFRDGQVTARFLRRAEGYTESWLEGSQVQGVRRSDVVVHGLDGFAGAIGTSEVDGVCSPVYHVCTPVGETDPLYIGRLLHVLAVSGYLGLFASSTRERAVDFRNWNLFGRIPIPAVQADEQQRIAVAMRKLAPLKELVDQSARLAREHRQALITAAVTGKLSIPGVAA